MKKKIVLLIIILLTVPAVFWIFRTSEKTNDLTLYGNVEIRQVNLAFRVSGRIEKMLYEEGEAVKKGQLLAQIDAAPYVQQLNQTKAALENATVESTNANILAQRNLPLCLEQTVSKQECDNIITARKAASAKVKEAQANLGYADLNFKDTNLYAPNEGIILTRILEQGTMVKAESPVYTLSLTKPMWVRTYISETDLGKIKLGMEAKVYTDANPDKPYTAHVGFVSPAAEFTPKTVETTTLRTDLVYRLRIIIDDTDEFLRQSMPVTVKIDLGETYDRKSR